MPTTLTILSNASTTSNVTIRDMGITIASGGGSETFTDTKNLKRARLSRYLRTLATDDAFGANSSTIIVNNGTDNIDQSDVTTFLDTLEVPLRHNIAATTTPTVNNDSSQGYGVGSRWINTTTDNEYVCLDATNGAAIWDIGAFNNNYLIFAGANGTTTTTSQSLEDVTGLSITVNAGVYWCTFSCSASYNKNSEALHVGIFAGPSTLQITSVTTVADVAGSLGGTYFNINSPGEVSTATNMYENLFYVWLDTGGSIDPAPAGRTGIQVTITANDTANAVATAVATAVNANANFSAPAPGANVVTITNAADRLVTNAVDVTTGFTISTPTPGSPTNSAGAFRQVGGQADNFGNPNSQGQITVLNNGDSIRPRWGITNNTGGGTGTLAVGRTFMAIRTS